MLYASCALSFQRSQIIQRDIFSFYQGNRHCGSKFETKLLSAVKTALVALLMLKILVIENARSTRYRKSYSCKSLLLLSFTPLPISRAGFTIG